MWGTWVGGNGGNPRRAGRIFTTETPEDVFTTEDTADLFTTEDTEDAED